MGSDTLTGGSGNDVIVINLADTSTAGTDKDVVTDLNKGDQLVIQDLLDDQDPGLLVVTESGSSTGTGTVTLTADSNGSASGGVVQTVDVQATNTTQLLVDALNVATNPDQIKVTIDPSSSHI